MRRIVVLSALVLGCTSNSLPIEGGTATSGGTNGSGSTTAGTTNGGTTSGTTTSGTTTSGTTTGGTTNGGTTGGTTTGGTSGTTTGGGGQGDKCATACDCQAGLACFQNQCVASPMGKFYCCDDTNNCPDGQLCQGSDSSIGMCGGGNAGQCKTACDCNAGEACFNGGCTPVPMGQLYCCETNCPSSGGFCQSMDGSFMQCGGGGGTIGGSGGTTGNPMQCMAIPCKQNSDCTAMGCARCSMRSNTCRAL